jgi:hypothetical protein
VTVTLSNGLSICPWMAEEYCICYYRFSYHEMLSPTS